MLEIIFLIVSCGGISAYARARGGNPVLWGAVAGAGYVIIIWIVPMFLTLPAESDARLWIILGAFGWVGAIALVTRFGIGSGRKKPSGMWNCPNCRYLNQHYAVICEACKHPFGEPVAKN
jgi:hypothetical protein